MAKIKTITVNGDTYEIYDPEAARIDDTAVGADAWSSRNIVDKLCPAFSESGSTVTCTPVEGYPLGVVSHIAPVQEIGSDGISPSSVCPITGWDSVTLWHGGKNLFDISRVQSNVGTVINNGDGSLSVKARARPASGAVTLRDYAPGLQPGKTYTLSADCSHTGNYIYLKGIDQSWSFGRARVITDACLDSKVYWYNSSDATGADTTENIIRNIQIEEGTAATEFEPYRGTEFTADFGQTVYGGSYDWQTGLLTVTHGNIAAYAAEEVPEGWLSSTGELSEGAQVVYPLAEPVTVQLTAQEILALSGTNVLRSDTGDTAVSGRQDLITLLQTLI